MDPYDLIEKVGSDVIVTQVGADETLDTASLRYVASLAAQEDPEGVQLVINSSARPIAAIVLPESIEPEANGYAVRVAPDADWYYVTSRTEARGEGTNALT